MGIQKLGGNSIDSNSLRDGNLFTKINQYMQLSIFNAKTIFQLSIGKNVDATNKKPNLIAKFTI
jgi:hypothetical protein